MTEPVARATPVRRTVRVAMALLAGQAVLCAVIGWVTFGSTEAGPHGKSAVAPLAGPSIVASPPRVGLPATTATPDTPVRKKRASPRSSSVTPVLPPAPPVEDIVDDQPPTEDPSPATVIAPAPTTTATTLPPPSPELAGSGSPTPAATTSQPPVVGGSCSPEGALGVTEDDVTLRCVREDDGLRWHAI